MAMKKQETIGREFVSDNETKLQLIAGLLVERDMLKDHIGNLEAALQGKDKELKVMHEAHEEERSKLTRDVR